MENVDVFISYRRTDVDFTKRLVASLKENGREVWVDWEDIPPGVEGFTDEIQRGIEGANAMLVVLSPNYLKSEYCIMELKEGLRLKKRMIPVVFQKFDPAPPPEGIGHINWVYFVPHAGQENVYDDAFKKVMEALTADYDYVREHTRLLIKAIDWDKRQRNASYVMKGAEITKAESWQIAAAAKEPALTPLHQEYILISRKVQRRQRERFLATVAVLLIVAVVAGLTALFQASEARRQQVQAALSADIAHSNTLSAGALLPGNEDIAMSLALEAMRSPNAPPDAFTTLADVAYRPGSLRYARLPQSTQPDFGLIRYPAVAPLGRYVVIGKERYDLKTGRADLTFKDTPEDILTGIYTSDGDNVIIAGDNSPTDHPTFMGLYNATTGDLIRRFDTGTGVADIQLSADNKTLVSYLPNSKVVWWDVASGSKIREFDLPDSSRATFSPDLKWLATLQTAAGATSTDLVITDLATNEITIREPLGFLASGPMRFNTNASEIAVKGLGDDIIVYDLPAGKPRLSLNSPGGNGIHSLRYSPDGNTMVVTGVNNVITLWDTQTGKAITTVTAHQRGLLSADYVRGGDGVISMGSDGTVLEWDTVRGNLQTHIAIAKEAPSVVVAPDNRTIALLEGCDLVTRDAATLAEVSRVTILSDGVCYGTVYVSSDGRDIKVFNVNTNPAMSGQSGGIGVYSLTTKTMQDWTDIPAFNPKDFEGYFLPDGQRIAVRYATVDGQHHLELRDLSGKLIQAYTPPNPPTYKSLAVSPDGTRLLVSSSALSSDPSASPFFVIVFDVATGKVVLNLNENVTRSWFSPDSKQIVTTRSLGGGDGPHDTEIVVWDATSGAQIRVLAGTIPQKTKLIFTPDGAHLFNLSGLGAFPGGIVEVVDQGQYLLPSGIPIGHDVEQLSSSFSEWDYLTGIRIRDFPVDASAAAVSPDSTRLVIADTTRAYTLTLWRLDSPEALKAYVCANRYVPEFTAEQQARFAITDPKSICPTEQTLSAAPAITTATIATAAPTSAR